MFEPDTISIRKNAKKMAELRVRMKTYYNDMSETDDDLIKSIEAKFEDIIKNHHDDVLKTTIKMYGVKPSKKLLARINAEISVNYQETYEEILEQEMNKGFIGNRQVNLGVRWYKTFKICKEKPSVELVRKAYNALQEKYNELKFIKESLNTSGKVFLSKYNRVKKGKENILESIKTIKEFTGVHPNFSIPNDVPETLG